MYQEDRFLSFGVISLIIDCLAPTLLLFKPSKFFKTSFNNFTFFQPLILKDMNQSDAFLFTIFCFVDMIKLIFKPIRMPVKTIKFNSYIVIREIDIKFFWFYYIPYICFYVIYVKLFIKAINSLCCLDSPV
jgi:hypothetical protein